MKYLLTSLLVICAYASLSSGQFLVDVNTMRDDLLRRAEFLINQVSGEVKILEVEGNALVSQGLQNELRLLIGLQLELRATQRTNATLTEIQAIEGALNGIEIRIGQLLAQISQQFVTRREIERLLRSSQEFIELISDTVKRLRNLSRNVEALGLERMEGEILLLQVAIRSTQNSVEIRMIEQTLVQLEYQIFEVIQGLEATGVRRKRDLRSDVIARATQLINITNAEIAELQRTNRTTGVSLLQSSITNLNQLVSQLRNATNETVILDLEGQLIVAEFQLADDLRRLGRPLSLNERRDLLITRADGLQRWAAAQIANARNRSIEVGRIQAQQQRIAQIANQLRNATLASDLTFLEEELDEAEEVLIAELLFLGQPLVPYEQIADLQRRAEDLALRLIVVIRQLRASNRILLAEGLQAEEQTLIDLDARLRTAVQPTQIAQIEVDLKAAETRILAELAKITV